MYRDAACATGLIIDDTQGECNRVSVAIDIIRVADNRLARCIQSVDGEHVIGSCSRIWCGIRKRKHDRIDHGVGSKGEMVECSWTHNNHAAVTGQGIRAIGQGEGERTWSWGRGEGE